MKPIWSMKKLRTAWRYASILRTYRKNLRYPADARKNGISGKVFVEFVIDTTGSLSTEKLNIERLYKRYR